MPTIDNAIRKLRQGDLKDGQRILEQLLEQDPDDPEVLYNLGMAYSEQGMFERSISTLEKCARLDTQNPNPYVALGFSYARNEEYHKAIDVLHRALEIDPEHFYALKNLGSIYGKLDEFDEAIRYFKAADGVVPDAPEVLYGLALTHEKKGQTGMADLLYRRIIELGDSEEFAELAREALTRMGMDTLKSKGPRYDAVMYCLGALQAFSEMTRAEIQHITFEIAMLGREGLDINDPEKKYPLRSLPGEFTGLRLLCYMYVGFQLLDPSVDVGADLSEEYRTALDLFEGEIR